MSDPPPPRPSLLAGVWRLVRGAFVFLIVSWHLFFLAVRNPLDLWGGRISSRLKQKGWWDLSLAAAGSGVDAGGPDGSWWREWGAYYRLADGLTCRFANGAGCEQNWGLFMPPMARRAPFLGTRYEFDDGSTETYSSPNEPDDPARYFRFGGSHTRKYEDCLMAGTDEAHVDFPVWSAHIRRLVRRWRERNPYDPRELTRVVLVKRYITFPAPGDPPGEYGPVEERVVQAFTPEGGIAR